ncbi:MAG TPA: LysM peptidoglycan-binding domain-containing protein [Solirubrobacteraceae bacterium]|jgi:LysM repeat protein|nr:LysM peptidoglycan-binding domain-containing protein [Solirubrobacteraceae bacterium]
MRNWNLPLLVASAALCLPATASAAFEHVVAPGESLYAVAAADGLSVDQLAAANGLSPDSELTAGATLAIPPQTGGTVATSSPTSSSESSAPADSSGSVTSSSGGGYLVQPGDTLSGIAARYGVSVDALASANGLDPAGILPAGDSLSVSGGSSSSAVEVSTTSPAPATSSGAGAQPTTESVSPSSVGSIAAQSGVSPSLAQAIADQESGFNNNEVSSTGATGVMQIEPGTWNYIQSNLGASTLGAGGTVSATDNVRGGVLLLRSLLDQTGGDPAMAAAGYYQGLASVQAHGMYADTQQYVNNVMALRQRFGGQ